MGQIEFQETDLINGVWEIGVAFPFCNTNFAKFEQTVEIAENTIVNSIIKVKGDVREKFGIQAGNIIWIGPSTSIINSNQFKGDVKQGLIKDFVYDNDLDITSITVDIMFNAGTGVPDSDFAVEEFLKNDWVTFKGLATGWEEYNLEESTVSVTNGNEHDKLLDPTTRKIREPFLEEDTNNDRLERADPLFSDDKRFFSQRIVRFAELNLKRREGQCRFAVNARPPRTSKGIVAGLCGNPNQLMSSGPDDTVSVFGTICGGDKDGVNDTNPLLTSPDDKTAKACHAFTTGINGWIGEIRGTRITGGDPEPPKAGILQTFQRKDRSRLHDDFLLFVKKTKCRVSTWFRLIPLHDFGTIGSSVTDVVLEEPKDSIARVEIEVYNYNTLAFKTALDTNRDLSEVLCLMSKIYTDVSPNILLSGLMDMGGDLTFNDKEQIPGEPAPTTGSNAENPNYVYTPMNTVAQPGGTPAVRVHPILSQVRVSVKGFYKEVGAVASPCRADADIQYVVVEHVRGTSQEAKGFFKTNTTPDVGGLRVEVVNRSQKRVKLQGGVINNFDVQGGNEKFVIKATWSNEKQLFADDMRVLESWSKKNYAIVLRPQMFNVMPPVLYVRMEVDIRMVKNSSGLNSYNVIAVFTEL